MNRTPISYFVRHVLFYMPAPLLALIIYMGLKSSMIFPDDGGYFFRDWHLAYVGWYDYILMGSIVMGLLMRKFHIPIKLLIFSCFTVFIVFLSFALNSFEMGIEPFGDSLVFLLRFFLVFFLTVGLVEIAGSENVERIFLILFWILAASSLFVLNLQYGLMNRLYAAGMTVSSFSQVAAIAFLISLTRKDNINMFVSAGFLFFTFSRTSFFLAALFAAFYLILTGRLGFRNKAQLFLVAASADSLGIIFSLKSEEFTSLYFRMSKQEEINTLNGRLDLWSASLDILFSGNIPFYGIGFNMSPSVTNKIGSFLTFLAPNIGFHNIVIEYFFSMGVFAVFIFYFLFKRIYLTFKERCFPAFLIFIFFFLSQSFDFNLYRPKEVVIWAVMLGLAEGQWRKMQAEKSEGLLKMQESSNSNIK